MTQLLLSHAHSVAASMRPTLGCALIYGVTDVFCRLRQTSMMCVPGDMPEPGELAALDDCQQRFQLACVGGDLLSGIVVCLVLPV